MIPELFDAAAAILAMLAMCCVGDWINGDA